MAVDWQRDNSMMTWEGTQLMGTQAIIEKINVSALSPAIVFDKLMVGAAQ